MAYYRKLTEGWRLTDGILNDCLLAEPCDVVAALTEVGHLKNPEKGMNALSCEWIYLRNWTYTVSFDAPEGDDERCLIEFGRLCGEGSVFLNSELQGTFVSGSARFDLTGSLRPGENRLTVCFDARLHERPAFCSPLPAIGIMEAPMIRMTNCVTVEQVNLSSLMEGEAGIIECGINLNAHVSGKYIFHYAVSLDGGMVQKQDIEEKLPAAKRALFHKIHVKLPVVYDKEKADETIYSVRLTVERGGIGCDVYHMDTAFRPADSGRKCLAVHEWPLSAETAEKLISLNADAVLPLNAPAEMLLENDFCQGLTIVREGEGISEMGMISEKMMKKYAAGEIYWPPDGPMWRYRGGGTPDSALMRNLTGEGVSMGAEKYALLVRFIQAARLTDQLNLLRKDGKRAVVPADEDFAYFSGDALIEKDGSLRPAAYAVKEAWKKRRVFSETPESARPGEKISITAWAADESVSGQTLSLRVQALKADGSEIAEETFTVMSGGVHQAGSLPVNLPAEEGIIVVRAEMKDMEGKLIDRSDRILCVSAAEPLKPLITLAASRLSMEKGLLKNDGSHAAVSAWQCLLPGEASAQAADEWLNI